jgi:peptidoglycan/xylan/chitin deacetylase (PgdA/CDA1 family)
MRKIASISIAIIGCLFLVLVAGFLYSRPWSNGLFLRPLSRLETEKRVVALTFDDGPSRNRTPPLLELLKAHDVKATFFMLGKNIEAHFDLAAQVSGNGHLIGNHSYSHPHLILKRPSAIRAEIEKTDALISALGQEEIQYFRPPYSSKFLLLPLILIREKKTLVTGTYDPPAQYRCPLDPLAMADQVINNTEPGSIVFLHDGNENYPTEFIEAVRLIIEGLKKKGYSFVRLDEVRN